MSITDVRVRVSVELQYKDRNSNTFLNLDLTVKVLTVGNIGVIDKINICPVNLVDFIENPILPTQFCGRVKRFPQHSHKVKTMGSTPISATMMMLFS